MKYIFVLFAIQVASTEAQLDLPQVKSAIQEGPEVSVLPNSYAIEKHDAQVKSDSSYRFESDRSQRFGPPYDSAENDENRGNQRDNSQTRYNSDPSVNVNRDNYRFPPNNNNFNTQNNNEDFNLRNQQVRLNYNNFGDYPFSSFNSSPTIM